MNHDRYHLFIDSGAWGLYRRHVLGRKDPTPENKYDFFSFAPGSKFREYLDDYARFMRRMTGKIELFANLDVIGSPERTWKVQQYFWKEHGLKPVPVVHHSKDVKESIRWLDRYIEAEHSLIGLGGMVGVGQPSIIAWCDVIFRYLCPASNRYLPIVRAHGFAITAIRLMIRYPWWSVDSTSWMKLAAFGGILVPRALRAKQSETPLWDFSRPPFNINFSYRSPKKDDGETHYCNLRQSTKKLVDLWLAENGIRVSQLEGDFLTKEGNKEVLAGSMDLVPEGRQQPARDARARMNITYFQRFREAGPEWPWPFYPKQRDTTFEDIGNL